MTIVIVIGMNRFALGVATSALALSLLSTTAFAKDSTPSGTRLPKLEERAQNIQTRIENTREKIASREATLKAKLQAFRDKKKAEAVDRIDTNLNKVNQNRTGEMTRNLTKMSDILTKLDTYAGQASSSGKDVSSATAAITSAKAAVLTAQAAVTEQSQKNYTLTITSEAKAKDDATSARNQLKTDLMATHQKVVDARQTVAKAIAATRTAIGGTK